MANNELTHMGYTGSVEVSIEDECLHGRILFIDDIVTYEGSSVHEITESFKAAVERYIAYCKDTGKEPNKPYSGTLNVRIGQKRHRAMAQRAYRQKNSLNELFCQAVDLLLAADANIMATTSQPMAQLAPNPVYTFLKTGQEIAVKMEKLSASYPDIIVTGNARVSQAVLEG